MRRMLLLAVPALLLAVPAAHRPAAQADDEASVRDVVRRYVEARERTDAGATRALFTEDADQLTSSGEWRRGREAVVRGTQASSQANTGTRSITIETVRFPAPGVALADGAYTIAASEDAPARNMHTTFLLVRSPSGWQISAIRNMLPAGS